MRNERERAGLPTVALAGYTNAGKSTLLNALTGAEVGVRDRLFHTLDPTTRQMEISGRTYLLTDTVGFIRKLPHQLVEAFGATLEEAMGADLLVHVVDASAPEEELHEMLSAVAGRAGGDRGGGGARGPGPEQGRPAGRRPPPRAVLPLPRGGPGVGRHRRGAGHAARGRRGPLPGHAAVDGAAGALRRRRVAVRAARRWPATWSARTRRRACSCAPACPRWPRRGSSASRSTATTDGAALPAAGRRRHGARARPRRRRGLRPVRLRGRRARAGGAGRGGHRHRASPSPRATPGWCCRARDWPASTA